MNDLAPLQGVLGVKFRDQGLLRQALVHRSYLNEHPEFSLSSNERMEYLGDALIGLVIAQELYACYPNLPEGELTALRAALVRRETLARVARSLGLGAHLLMGMGEEASGGRERPSILAATFEAVVGAVLLDLGYARGRGLVLRCLHPELRHLAREGVPKDPKSQLQELVQGQGKVSPVYRVTATEGPDHARRFTVEVLVDGQVVGVGEGRRKLDAERAAAEAGLALDPHFSDPGNSEATVHYG